VRLLPPRPERCGGFQPAHSGAGIKIYKSFYQNRAVTRKNKRHRANRNQSLPQRLRCYVRRMKSNRNPYPASIQRRRQPPPLALCHLAETELLLFCIGAIDLNTVTVAHQESKNRVLYVSMKNTRMRSETGRPVSTISTRQCAASSSSISRLPHCRHHGDRCRTEEGVFSFPGCELSTPFAGHRIAPLRKPLHVP